MLNTWDKISPIGYCDPNVSAQTTQFSRDLFLFHSARKNMVLPLSKPIKTTTGAHISEIAVPNGTTLFISIYGANADPGVWGDDAHEWKPERWLKPIPDSVLAAHMPGIFSNL